MKGLGVSSFYDYDYLHHLLAAEVGWSFLDHVQLVGNFRSGWGRGVGLDHAPGQCLRAGRRGHAPK